VLVADLSLLNLTDEVGEQIRAVGREFGATTGRPRRCGWLDLPALNYAIMINGVTELMMMKADILSEFDTIKVCTHYKFKGETIDYLPYDIIDEAVEPVYIEMKGWKVDLTQMDQQEQLPVELTDYVKFIEKETGVPIKVVSIGPDRKQTIMMNEVLVK
jgi:adenylosuccinate synthase